MGQNSNSAFGPHVHPPSKTHHTLYIGGIPGKLTQIHLFPVQAHLKSLKYRQYHNNDLMNYELIIPYVLFFKIKITFRGQYERCACSVVD